MDAIGRMNLIGQGMDLLTTFLGLGWGPLPLFPPTPLRTRLNRGQR